jgi:hypothetical protein
MINIVLKCVPRCMPTGTVFPHPYSSSAALLKGYVLSTRAEFVLFLFLHSIPVAEQSMARVCGCSLAGVAGSYPVGDMSVYVVCCRRISDTGTEDIEVSNG